MGMPSLVNAYPSSEAKNAGLCNKLVLQDGVTLSTATPPEATARWPSGTTVAFRAISSATAFSAMLRVPSGAGGAMCDGVKPLLITAVRWGTAGVGTDRGTAQMSAWLFHADGVSGDFAYPGLDPAAYWRGGLMPGGSGPGTSGRVSSDGRTLTIGFVGAADKPGPCGSDYSAAAAESGTAVAVALKSFPHDSGQAAFCDLVGHFRTVTVHLAAPLGGRVLVDENGNVGVACPDSKAC
jgi:hypothetical protein